MAHAPTQVMPRPVTCSSAVRVRGWNRLVTRLVLQRRPHAGECMQSCLPDLLAGWSMLAGLCMSQYAAAAGALPTTAPPCVLGQPSMVSRWAEHLGTTLQVAGYWSPPWGVATSQMLPRGGGVSVGENISIMVSLSPSHPLSAGTPSLQVLVLGSCPMLSPTL